MKQCKKCEAPIMENDKFCAYCGKRLYEALESRDMDSIYVETEPYNSKGEKKYRYVIKKERYGPDIYAKFALQPEVKDIISVFHFKDVPWFTCNYEERLWFICEHIDNKHYVLGKMKESGKKIKILGVLNGLESVGGNNEISALEDGVLFISRECGKIWRYYEKVNEIRCYDMTNGKNRSDELEDVFQYDNVEPYENGVFVVYKKDGYGIYEDGAYHPIEEYIDYSKIKKTIINWENNKNFYSMPSSLMYREHLRDSYVRQCREAGIRILYINLEDDEISLEYKYTGRDYKNYSYKFLVDMETGQVKREDDESILLYEEAKKFIPWREVKDRFKELEEFLYYKRLQGYIVKNKISEYIESEILGVYAYDDTTVTVALRMKLYDYGEMESNVEDYCGVFDKNSGKFCYRKAKECTTINDMQNGTYVISREDYLPLNTMTLQTPDILKMLQPKLEPLVRGLEKCLQQNAWNKGERNYSNKHMNFSLFSRKIYKVIGLIVESNKDLFILFNYPLKLDGYDVPNDKIKGILLLMDLSDLEYKECMLVRYLFGEESYVLSEVDVKAKSNKEIFSLSKGKENRIKFPKVYTSDDVKDIVPSLQNKDNFRQEGTNGYPVAEYRVKETFYGENVTYNLEKPQAEDLLQNCSFLYCWNSYKIPHPQLQNMQAYALLPNGICYVIKNEFFIWIQNQKPQKLEYNFGTILSVEYKDETLIITIFEKFVFRGYEEKDVWGYSGTEIVNKYDVITKEIKIPLKK